MVIEVPNLTVFAQDVRSTVLAQLSPNGAAALDPALLRGALGDIGNLPKAEELGNAADAEVRAAFFVQDQELPPALIETAWVLHQVGTVRPALQIYEPERQVQANSVAAHLFDLALSGDSSQARS